jgi:hypothetical protein
LRHGIPTELLSEIARMRQVTGKMNLRTVAQKIAREAADHGASLADA